MKAVVDRRRRFGRRAWAATAGAVWALCLGTTPAFAADSYEGFRAQSGMATLPLLAAMAFGIVVAVVAVIAFLQMTNQSRGISDEQTAAGEETAEERFEASAGAESFGKTDRNRRDSLFQTMDVALPGDARQWSSPAARPEPAQKAAEGEPRLCGLDGEFAGSSFRVTERALYIGRDALQCGLVFPSDAGDVSRKHCSLRYVADRRTFLLEDHGSSNGTFLSDGRRLVPGRIYELLPGDEFTLSGSKHRFEVRD
ncbi:FHA domain-containing protein [Cohnella laeviribosi]|uniref:FHA domain-containing protein n=1 Tax=Cohnella laeviribosi TaxID=380174 RepID=UPI003D2484E9